MLNVLLAFIIAYLLGAIPTAELLARFKGRSIFDIGSGNMGAMNTARNLGMGLGIVVLLVDVLKGVLASLIGLQLGTADLPYTAAAAAGIGAVLGHAYSPYVRFRGGKALATAFGVALPVYPLAAIITLVLLLILSLSMKKQTTLAALITVLLYPLIGVIMLYWQVSSGEQFISLLISIVLITVIIARKHLVELQALGNKSAS